VKIGEFLLCIEQFLLKVAQFQLKIGVFLLDFQEFLFKLEVFHLNIEEFLRDGMPEPSGMVLCYKPAPFNQPLV
jgi:hypothetical protein